MDKPRRGTPEELADPAFIFSHLADLFREQFNTELRLREAFSHGEAINEGKDRFMASAWIEQNPEVVIETLPLALEALLRSVAVVVAHSNESLLAQLRQQH